MDSYSFIRKNKYFFSLRHLDQLSQYKRLRGGVVFVNSLPKTASGKVVRRELKNISSSL